MQVYEKNIIVVGDNEKDIIPAKAMSMISVRVIVLGELPHFQHDAYGGTYPQAAPSQHDTWDRAERGRGPVWPGCSLRRRSAQALH